MVLIGECTPQPAPCIEFEANIYVLSSSNNSAMSRGYQAVIHIGNVCQPARLLHIDKVIESGERWACSGGD